MLVFESLSEFLNEDLGNLKPFADLPPEWKKELLDPYKRGGKNSRVELIPWDIDYKAFLKKMKDPAFEVAFVKKDGQTSFSIRSESTNKFRVERLEGLYSETKKKREKEKLEREAALKKTTSVGESLLERRGYHSPDYALEGSMSVPDLHEWMKRQKEKYPNSNFEFYIIYQDKERIEKAQKRQRGRWNDDPMSPSETRQEFTKAQRSRYEIFAEKKRAEIDKKFDTVLDDFKKQLINNFDQAMEKVVDDMRRGFSWNITSEEIGKRIMKGIDMTDLKKFTEAYDVIEPDSYKPDAVEASKKLKKLGF